ncbi:HU family DNA-binding protein [Thermodesulfobacteriota bacterium]
MNKSDLIEKIADDASITKTAADRALEALLEGIKESLTAEGSKVTLSGFGTFSKVHRKERQGVNIATGEMMTIIARDAVKFKPGKALQEAVA